MHCVIRAIVYGESKGEALDRAKDIFEELVKRRKFDYYVTFDIDGSGVAGKDRWGPLPAVIKADTEKGKELIKDGMKFHRDNLLEDLARVRKLMNENSDEEIADMKPIDKAPFRGIGKYSGWGVYLYDNDGCGITDSDHLKNVLNKWGEDEYKDMKVYVVPADVHY